MRHIFPCGDHMEIESLRLDFQPYKYQKIAQNISEKNLEKEEKKKN